MFHSRWDNQHKTCTAFAGIRKEFPQAIPFIHGLDADHKFLEPLLIDNERDTAYYEFSSFLQEIADDSGKVPLEQGLLVPAMADKLPIKLSPPKHDTYEGYYFWGCVELVNQLIHGPVMLLDWVLSGSGHAFDCFNGEYAITNGKNALVVFLFRLLQKLQSLGTVPVIDWNAYANQLANNSPENSHV